VGILPPSLPKKTIATIAAMRNGGKRHTRKQHNIQIDSKKKHTCIVAFEVPRLVLHLDHLLPSMRARCMYKHSSDWTRIHGNVTTSPVILRLSWWFNDLAGQERIPPTVQFLSVIGNSARQKPEHKQQKKSHQKSSRIN
jgi:hypothetical protein